MLRHVSEVTCILDRIQCGDSKAANQLLPLVYEELRKLAACKMASEPAGHTLQPTALVHEAWMRLAGSPVQRWDNRGHFFAAAAEAMRRILIDRARAKCRQKRGGDWERRSLDEVQLAVESDPVTLLSVNEAMEKLSQQFPEIGDVVKLRFFAGLSIEEAADALNISVATVKRHWAFARAWLYQQLEEETGKK